ncbi:HD domain-containing protein [Aureivirga marina]|uniref:HD domain-containing protein n=1 Tax=Aureivirga marina TaxID=1182451 RepID=UPI0018CBA435|nr:HD domain-containing protein [Aureivirga marina]
MLQETYQKAIKFAGEKHANQKVPGSEANYVVHLSNVAMEILVAYNEEANFDIDFAVQLAILHDVLEDTDTTLLELEKHFGEKVSEGILALTKSKELKSKQEQISDSLSRINLLEKEVGLVKLADRITNLQEPPNHWDKERIKTYLEEAKYIAKKLKSKNRYLNKRLLQCIFNYENYTK